MKIKKQKTTKQLKAELDKTFSLYIRLRDAKKTTNGIEFAICCTCGKPYKIKGMNCIQAGHFISRKYNSVRWNEKNVHAQCVACNVFLHGNYIAYYDFMVKTYGKETIDLLTIQSHQYKSLQRFELEMFIEYYKKKINDYY
jgi:hypothetical protein